LGGMGGKKDVRLNREKCHEVEILETKRQTCFRSSIAHLECWLMPLHIPG